MKIINLFGGAGSGKSTVAAGLFYRMKVAGTNAELVTEFAKDLNYGGQIASMMDQQEYIFAEQNYRQHRLRPHVDYAITDSPLMLSTIYAPQDYPIRTKFCEFVLATNGLYDNINIFLLRPEIFQETGRYHTLEEAISVDNEILTMLYTYNIPFNSVQTGDGVLDQIMEIVDHFA
jgi:nicotinamide riboside kinase